MKYNEEREMILYYYLINYIAIFDVDLKNEEEIFLHDNFLEVLIYILENNADFGYLTKEMYERIGKLIQYIKENMESELIEQLIEKYNNIDCYSYGFYENEFVYKYNIINEDLKNKAFIWNKKEIEELVREDYFLFLGLELDDKEFNKYNKIYTNNINSLLFLNKLINMFPTVLLDNKYKKRIISILKYNKEKIDDKEMLKINENLYNQIVNFDKKNIEIVFNSKIFEQLYYEAIFEKMIVLGEEYNIDYSNNEILEQLYALINHYDHRNMCSKDMKYRIINIMDNFKYGVKDLDKRKYNEYLVKVNSMNLSDYEFIIDYFYKKGINNYKEIRQNPYLINEYLGLINNDIAFLESLLCDNDYDEKYLKHFIYNDDYILSVKRYMKECPLLFKNKDILDKVTKTIECIMNEYTEGRLNSKDYYTMNKKVIKKLKKDKN